MDTTETTCIELCAGYGGITLGLKRAVPDLRVVASCEIEAFACANLVAKMEAGLMDPAPVWTDVKTLPWAEFRGKVDILTGGYPCQPFSSAGKRLGGEDLRHLWPHIARGIRILQPGVCFFENVEGHITQGLHHVLCDLGSMGYRTTWGIFSASECGAPHQRKRVFILAYRNGERGQLQTWRRIATEQVSIGSGTTRGNVWPSRPGEPQYEWEPPRTVEDTKRIGRRGRCDGDEAGESREVQATGSCGALGNTAVWQDDRREAGDVGEKTSKRRRGDDAADGAGEAMGNTKNTNRRPGIGTTQEGIGAHGVRRGRPGEPDEWPLEQPLGRDPDEPSDRLDYAELCVSCDNRTDELRLLGNGVVPATVEKAWRTLVDEVLKAEEEV